MANSYLIFPNLYPKELILGIEIREKVAKYVFETILAMRKAENNKKYHNISVIHTNAMQYLKNYIWDNQISKIFIWFPDPYFKRKQHKRRIFSERMVNEFVSVLQPGGKIYSITDIKGKPTAYSIKYH